MAPILPFLSDSPEQLRATVEAIAEAGATHISPIVLHLRTGAREWFMRWLAEHHPELVPRYEALYRNRAYAPKDFQSAIAAKVKELADDCGIGRLDPKGARRIAPAADAVPRAAPIAPTEQLSLL